MSSVQESIPNLLLLSFSAPDAETPRLHPLQLQLEPDRHAGRARRVPTPGFLILQGGD